MLYPKVAVILLAQWVNISIPNTPRTPDGKPNLDAPAPRSSDGKPDLSGIWRVADGRYLQNIAVDIGEAPFQPWAAALFKERADALGKQRPSLHSTWYTRRHAGAKFTLQAGSNARCGCDPLRRIQSLPADLYRRTQLSCRNESELVWIFDREVGRGRIRSGDAWLQR